MTTKVEKHVKQRFALKVLRYYAGQRGTDPAAHAGGRMGMTEGAALKHKEEVRNLIMMAAANIRSGKK
jgi:hypothetical protein